MTGRDIHNATVVIGDHNLVGNTLLIAEQTTAALLRTLRVDYSTAEQLRKATQ